MNKTGVISPKAAFVHFRRLIWKFWKDGRAIKNQKCKECRVGKGLVYCTCRYNLLAGEMRTLRNRVYCIKWTSASVRYRSLLWFRLWIPTVTRFSFYSECAKSYQLSSDSQCNSLGSPVLRLPPPTKLSATISRTSWMSENVAQNAI